MRVRNLIVIALCVALIAFFGLACCCPMAFPTGDWTDSDAGVSANRVNISQLP